MYCVVFSLCVCTYVVCTCVFMQVSLVNVCIFFQLISLKCIYEGYCEQHKSVIVKVLIHSALYLCSFLSCVCTALWMNVYIHICVCELRCMCVCLTVCSCRSMCFFCLWMPLSVFFMHFGLGFVCDKSCKIAPLFSSVNNSFV